MKDVQAYEFGEFRIDPVMRQLTRRGLPISIRPLHFELLLLLVEHHGEIVTREEIIEKVWTESLIEDANITQGIHFLRRILDDPAQAESLIVTIPKRGYLLAAEVTPISNEWSAVPDSLEIDHPPPPSGQRRLAGAPSLRWLVQVGFAGLVLITAVLLGSYLIFQSSIRSLTILSHYAIPSHDLDPEFSPDGKFLAFSSYGETPGNEDIYLKTVDEAQRIRLTTHPDADRNPVWSPDGERIAFLRWSPDDRQMARVIITDNKGSDEMEVARSRGALGWMPDGDHLIVSDLAENVTGSTVLYLITIDGRKRRPLTSSTGAGAVDTMPRAAFYRPEIAFLRTTGGSRGEIHLLDLPSGRVSQITNEDGAISFFHWGLREGGFYLVSHRTGEPRLWHFGLPGLISTFYGNTGPARLVDQMPYQLNQFTIRPGHPLLAYAYQVREEQVRLIELRGREIQPRDGSCLLAEGRLDEPPQFSPQGEQVVFFSTQATPEREDVVWLAPPAPMAPMGCQPRSLLMSRSAGRLGHLRWSPDGSRLVFAERIEGQTEIWMIGKDGSNLVRLTSNAVDDLDPSWSADGQSIYYVTLEDGRETIRRTPASGGDSVPIVTDGGREPVESADRQTIYFVRDGLLFAHPLGSTGSRQLLPQRFKDSQFGRDWQLTASGFSFITADIDGESLLNQLNLSTGKIEQIAKISGVRASAVSGIALSPLNRYLSIVYYQGSIGELTTVSGWRLKPFTEYMIDKLRLDWLFQPQRWW